MFPVSRSPRTGSMPCLGVGDNTLRLWDLTTGVCVREFKGHTHYVYSVTLTPDGKHAVSGSYDKTLRLWDLTTGDCVKVLNYQTSVCSCVIHLRTPHLYALVGLHDGTLEYRHLHTYPELKPSAAIPLPPVPPRPPRPIPTPPALTASPLSSATPHSAPDAKAPQESEEVKRLKERIKQLELQAQTSSKSESHSPASFRISRSNTHVPNPQR